MKDAYRSQGSGETRRAVAGIAGAVGAALALAGCSFSIPSLIGGGPEESTGSIRKAETRLSADLGQEDWRRAKGALALALDPQGNGRPFKWDNPETHLSGDVTPAGQPFVENDEICRRFTASFAGPAGRTEREGYACRVAAEDWAIKEVRAPK